jgi:micrococcal nuclease
LKKLIFSTLAVLVLFFGSFTTGYAHSGGKDELGGHFKRADCTYHFHGKTSLAQGKTKKQLIPIIKKYNSNNKCTKTLTESKITL